MRAASTSIHLSVMRDRSPMGDKVYHPIGLPALLKLRQDFSNHLFLSLFLSLHDQSKT